MPLTAGTQLGPYEILAPIGAGGMGGVYKARDTRLDRTVAIKISAEQFGERFEREARAVAAARTECSRPGGNWIVSQSEANPHEREVDSCMCSRGHRLGMAGFAVVAG